MFRRQTLLRRARSPISCTCVTICCRVFILLRLFFRPMPELPEVETIARGLENRVRGRQIVRVDLCGQRVFRDSPEVFVTGIEGLFVAAITRHGKALYLELTTDDKPMGVLNIHLG